MIRMEGVVHVPKLFNILRFKSPLVRNFVFFADIQPLVTQPHYTQLETANERGGTIRL